MMKCKDGKKEGVEREVQNVSRMREKKEERREMRNRERIRSSLGKRPN